VVVIWSPNLSVRQILGSEPDVRHSVSNDGVILHLKNKNLRSLLHETSEV